MHDFQKATSEAVPELLAAAQGRRLQDRAHEAAKAPVQSLPQYDEELMKDAKLPTVSQRPVSSVVQTISE